jgi:hypothetical protein
MINSWEFHSKKVWEFIISKNIKINGNLNSKEIYEQYITNNGLLLQEYSDFNWYGTDGEHPNDIKIMESRESFSRLSAENLNEKDNIPTFFDLKYALSSKIFEAEEVMNTTPEQLQEAEKAYYTILDKLNKGEEIDEGFLGALAGGAVGALAGPSIGRAICRALGIDENGNLGKLLTSRLVTTAIGIALGK